MVKPYISAIEGVLPQGVLLLNILDLQENDAAIESIKNKTKDVEYFIKIIDALNAYMVAHSLNEYRQELIILAFGIDDVLQGRARTSQEVAKRIGKNHPQVQADIRKSVYRLREPKRSRYLRYLMPEFFEHWTGAFVANTPLEEVEISARTKSLLNINRCETLGDFIVSWRSLGWKGFKTSRHNISAQMELEDLFRTHEQSCAV
jgi:hypothetical protein